MYVKREEKWTKERKGVHSSRKITPYYLGFDCVNGGDILVKWIVGKEWFELNHLGEMQDELTKNHHQQQQQAGYIKYRNTIKYYCIKCSSFSPATQDYRLFVLV